MKVKILFAPFAIVMSIIILIFWAWPAFKDLQVEIGNKNAKKDTLNNVLGKLDNLRKTKSQLDQNLDKENFILSYLPSKKDEERVINAINFLATSSQLSLINVDIKKPEEAQIIEEPELDVQGKPMPTKNKIKYFTAVINVSGPYENIERFLNSLNKMEFLNKINEINIAPPQDENNPDSRNVNPQFLVGLFNADFGYLAPTLVGNNLSAPIFSTTSFDLGSIDKIMKVVMEKSPVLEVGPQGRSNPFSL